MVLGGHTFGGGYCGGGVVGVDNSCGGVCW